LSITKSLVYGLYGALLAALPVAAEPVPLPEDRQPVLACVDAMESDADWDQCLTLIFAPCEGLDVGTPLHLECLVSERQVWIKALEHEQATLSDLLIPTASSEMAAIMGEWIGYVGQKCGDVAKEKASISAEAAQLGCEIAEAVGVTSEFAACRAGNSTAPYCILRD
jgi:hypothetical protein